VAVINEQIAAHYWPGQNPIGKRFRLKDGDAAWIEIVGVAKTSKYVSIVEPPLEFVYFPYVQRPERRMVLMAESAADPSALVAPLRNVVRGMDANQPIYNVRSLDENYRMRAVVIFNVIIALVAAMGVMGLALALVGLYGLVAYAATRRTKEIGIRMAIGASELTVIRMVLGQGLVLAMIGLAAGLVVSVGAGRALGAVFPGGASGSGRADVAAYVMVAAAVFIVTLVAAYIPARRASRIDPIAALRCE
jgi:predicted lysophospholipase L1 biosynthesis ABC-type transport system permease subunit